VFGSAFAASGSLRVIILRYVDDGVEGKARWVST
jgi:hypothetical protein